MKTLLKRLRTFCLEKNHLWLNPLNKEKTPDGILIYQDKRKNLFFSAEEFARTLHNLTGRKIYMAQIAHYNMKALHPRGNNTVAWCWRHNRFFYFAPVGGNRIFLALTRQYQYYRRCKASVILDEKYENGDVPSLIVLNYRTTENLILQPLELLLERKEKRLLLAEYAAGDNASLVMNDIRNWQNRNLELGSVLRIG